MQILGLHAKDQLSQKVWGKGRGPASTLCFNKLPAESDTCSGVKITGFFGTQGES